MKNLIPILTFLTVFSGCSTGNKIDPIKVGDKMPYELIYQESVFRGSIDTYLPGRRINREIIDIDGDVDYDVMAAFIACGFDKKYPFPYGILDRKNKLLFLDNKMGKGEIRYPIDTFVDEIIFNPGNRDSSKDSPDCVYFKDFLKNQP